MCNKFDMEKCSQRTEIFTVLSLELTSIVDLLKLKMHCPHQVFLRFMYSKGTPVFDDLGICVEIYSPYPLTLVNIIILLWIPIFAIFFYV